MDAEIPTVGNDIVDYSGLSRDELEQQLKEHVQESEKIRSHLKSEVRRHRDTSAKLNLISRVVENAHFAVMIT
ncbi:hypothetical protein ABMA58_18935, partial [Oceanospirillum sp. HFRX-1_2]